MKWNVPVIKDSLPTANKILETKYIRNPINQLLYIGTKKDTILITKKSLNINQYYSEFIEIDTIQRESKIELIADTEQELSIDLENFSFPPPPVALKGSDGLEIDETKTDSVYEIWKKRPRNYVKAYPVFIRNPSKDTIHIDNQDGALFLIQEAKNKMGEWKPIEYWIYSTCGNSYAYTSLGPDDILILKKVKYKGTFETEMRLKLRTNNKLVYSKPFKGLINIEQFELENVDGFTKRRLKNRDEDYIDHIFLNQ
ncbi:hypothetical protein EGM88_14060 [Aureibaculum marinum]|uniref:Uncharacterized protein n=2 Tax=Aureibaculum marinum TaxID=2487930 RepID=A0A3N4NC42_9FLAO|nr:hypothetical protein EGM88_14060 [Aureibaculum marinum]